MYTDDGDVIRPYNKQFVIYTISTRDRLNYEKVKYLNI